MPDRPSNADIMRAIGSLDEKVDEVKELATRTNGRVTKLEIEAAQNKAVEEYKKETSVVINNPKAGSVQIQPRWFMNEKLVGGVVAILLAIATAIGFIAGGQS